MRFLAIAALVLVTGCADFSRGGAQTGITPKLRPIENGKPVPRETFKARFGKWREITTDIWIKEK